MTSTTINPSLKTYLSRVFAVMLTLVCLLLPAKPDNVILSVKGSGCGTEELNGSTYCYVNVSMENRTNRTVCKPDYAVLEKELDGEWIYVSKGVIPQEDYWTLGHSGTIGEAFYFSLGEMTSLNPGEYRITIHYTVKSLSNGSKGQASSEFTVS